MYGIALVLLGFNGAADPFELPSDVVDFPSTQVIFPIDLSDDWRSKIKQFRLFVSDDRGKSWTHTGDYEATTEQVMFEAPEDGLYWFAVQVVFKDGKSEPSDPKKLLAERKVFVNTTGMPVKVRKSYTELLRENEELRKKVEELEKKLAERESGQKPK